MTAAHVFSFEIWPDPMPAATWPVLIPDQVTVTATGYDAARELACTAMAGRSQPGWRGLAAGRSLGACSHHRGRCDPPHPGRLFRPAGQNIQGHRKARTHE